MPRVLLGLGSNVGDRLVNLQSAIRELRHVIDVDAVAAVYETAPMYVVDQPSFLNSALAGRTSLSPRALLFQLKAAEERIGRVSGERFGPRMIDIDLLSYGALAYRFVDRGELKLQVPHPKIAERRFVLAPLAELDSGAMLPGLGVVAGLLERTNDQADSVTRVKDAVLSIHSN